MACWQLLLVPYTAGSFVTMESVYADRSSSSCLQADTQHLSLQRKKVRAKPSVRAIGVDYTPQVFDKKAKTESCSSTSADPFYTDQLKPP